MSQLSGTHVGGNFYYLYMNRRDTINQRFVFLIQASRHSTAGSKKS